MYSGPGSLRSENWGWSLEKPFLGKLRGSCGICSWIFNNKRELCEVIQRKCQAFPDYSSSVFWKTTHTGMKKTVSHVPSRTMLHWRVSGSLRKVSMLSFSWEALCEHSAASSAPRAHWVSTFKCCRDILKGRPLLDDFSPHSELRFSEVPFVEFLWRWEGLEGLGGAGAVVLLVERTLRERGSRGLRAGVCELWNPLRGFKMLSNTVLRNDTF